MRLSSEIENKIAELYLSLKSEKLSVARKNLTEKYKAQTASGKTLIDSAEESALYAVSRMPATFACLSSLLKQLIFENKLKEISSVADVGSGTGAGYFAIKNNFEQVDISLVERDKNMIFVFNKLEKDKQVLCADIVCDQINLKADLVICSYVLNEIPQEKRLQVLNKLLEMSEKYVLLVDSGTPKNYEYMMQLKAELADKNAKVVAPCMSEICTLKNDYCQFYARVERSSLLRQSKSGALPYEDEKYFYLLIEKQQNNNDGNLNKRVIRRPNIKTNVVELVVCSNSGVQNIQVTKKDKQQFKVAKKVKINELL